MGARKKSEDYGELQSFVEGLYGNDEELELSRLEIIIQAEACDLNCDLLEVISLLPPSRYTREKLCSQLNSSLSSHGWGYVYGAVH